MIFTIFCTIASFFLLTFFFKKTFPLFYNWFHIRKQRVYLLLSILNRLENPSNSNTSPSSFTVTDCGTSAILTYQRLNRNYIVTLPYSRRQIVPMAQFTVHLLRDNEPPLDITQQPGIPYLTSASDLGGSAIRITNEDTGFSFLYKNSHVPMYGSEVFSDPQN